MTLDTDFLIKNIAMLDNNTISIDHLTNKFCVILSKMGYERTEALENSINDIVTKYKKKQINSDEFVSMFNSITASNSSNTNTQSGNTTNTHNGNTNNTQSGNTNTSTNTGTNANTNSRNTNPRTSDVNTSKNTSKINKNKDTSENTTQTSSGNSSSNDSNVVEIDTSSSEAANANIQDIEATVTDAKLEVPAKVKEFTGTLETAAETAKDNINNEITELKTEIVEAVNTVIDVDDNIPKLTIGQSLKDIVSAAYDVSQNRATQRATEEFFRNGGCKIEGNCAILTVDGKECKYDMKKHKFYVNGKYAFDAEFFVPSGVTNYSQCNTYTYFCSSDYNDVINKRNTNSVVLKITKYSEKVHFDKYSEVATATKFTNQVAKTDLNNCQNVIGGDSVYGAHSLKIAAKSGDLYQTVYCVDNAALVTDINARRNNKEQFSTIEELKGLDGKNVIFMSASGDDNLACHYGNSTMTKCPYDQSYTYTGVKLVCETCPNAKVSFIYQPTKSYQNKIASLYKDLENKYSNFSYDTSAWDSYARKRYEYHSGGNYIVSDLAEAPATNVNRYNT